MVHRRDGGWEGLTVIQSKDKCVVGAFRIITSDII